MPMRSYILLAAAVAAGLGAFELLRLVVNDGRTAGHTLVSSLIGGLAFVALNAVTAVGLALQRRFGWGVGVAAAVISFAHGVVVRAGGSWAGVAYMVGGAVMLACLAKALAPFRSEGVHA